MVFAQLGIVGIETDDLLYFAKIEQILSRCFLLQPHQRLLHGAEFKPTGYSYYLRGNVGVVRDGNAMIVGDAVGLASVDMGEGIGPAVSSALLAADAIVGIDEYDLRKLSKYSVPSFFHNRGNGRANWIPRAGSA